jgi:GNAT superfamily N-acetyltransferase
MKTMTNLARRAGQTLNRWFRIDVTETVDLGKAGTFRIRRANPEDAPALLAMHDRLSARSVHFRYLMSWRPALTDMETLCSPPGGTGKTLVATPIETPDAIVGVACYRIEPGRDVRTAEPAVLVEDTHQNRGLGRRLFRKLLRMAEADGVFAMETTVHPANDRMKWILQTSGFPAVEERDRDSLGIYLLLRSEYEADFIRDHCGAAGSYCGFQFGFGLA